MLYVRHIGSFGIIVCFMLNMSIALHSQTRRALVIGIGQQEDKAWIKINSDEDVLYIEADEECKV